MTIENIESDWESRVRWYTREISVPHPLAHMAIKCMPKLLKVAKAAKDCIQHCQCCADVIEAVEELESME